MKLTARSFLVAASLVFAPMAASADKATATATVSVSIKADVNAKAQAQAAAGDAAYAAKNFEAALAAYGDGFAKTRDAAFVYAMARCHAALGHTDDAKVMFKMYLGAKGTLKFKGEAETEIGATAKGVTSKVTGITHKVESAVVDIGGGVYGAVKLGVSGSLSAGAKAKAEVADKAYAAGKFAEAAHGYVEAYAVSQESVALYAAAQAHAQAGNTLEARGMLLGYLSANPSGKYADDAKTLLLALGARAQETVKVSVAAKVSADLKANVEVADKAYAAGKYLDAVKAYGDAYAKKSDAALLYAKGMAQLYAGQTADAAASLKAYLAAGGNLEFKASAQANLRVAGAA